MRQSAPSCCMERRRDQLQNLSSAPSMSHRRNISKESKDFTGLISVATRLSCNVPLKLLSRRSSPSVLFRGTATSFACHATPQHGSHSTSTPPYTDGSDHEDTHPLGGNTKPMNCSPKPTSRWKKL
jgi:hypothetical protein